MFAHFNRLISALLPAAAMREPANALFESANVRGGLDQRQALELREAAQAYLRVVR